MSPPDQFSSPLTIVSGVLHQPTLPPAVAAVSHSVIRFRCLLSSAAGTPWDSKIANSRLSKKRVPFSFTACNKSANNRHRIFLAMRDLEEKAAKLLETATKLPPGPERHGLLNEIGTFRAPIAVMIAKLSKNSCSQPSKAASVGGRFHCPSKFEISAERRDQHHAHDGERPIRSCSSGPYQNGLFGL